MLNTSRWAAAAAVLGIAVLVSGAGSARPDDKTKPADKKPAFDPKDVRVGPPPELAALRQAVEDAARKGENVDEIRKQLDALETALAGKPWVKPKPADEPPAPSGVRPVPPRDVPPFFGGIQPAPADLEAIQKAQKLMLEAALLQADDPKKAAELMKEARELMMKGLRPGGGLVVPVFPGGGLVLPPRGGNARLGIRVESVPPALAEKAGIPDGRGVRVAEVLPDTAAEKAGLKAGDIITEFAGKPVGDDPTEFVRTVQGTRGAKVDITYYRDGKKAEAKGVQLADDVTGALRRVRPEVDR